MSVGVVDAAIEDILKNIKTGLLKTTEEVCGTTRPYHWRCETWWWNEHVEKAIAAKWKAFKAWKTGNGTRATNDAAKHTARQAVHHASQEATRRSTRILTSSLKKSTALLTSIEERRLMLLMTNW